MSTFTDHHLNEMNEPDSYEPPITMYDAQLAVIEAAKTERRASLALADIRATGGVFDGAVKRWSAACRATDAAVDTLLALEAESE
jgi:hypothetical protein